MQFRIFSEFLLAFHGRFSGIRAAIHASFSIGALTDTRPKLRDRPGFDLMPGKGRPVPPPQRRLPQRFGVIQDE